MAKLRRHLRLRRAIMARVGPRGDALGRSLGVALLGVVVMMPLALATGEAWTPRVGIEAAIALGLLGLFSTGIAMIVYFRLIAEAGPTFMSLINYLIPLWALVLNYVVGTPLPKSKAAPPAPAPFICDKARHRE